MLNFRSLIDDLLAIINQFADSHRLASLEFDFLQSKLLQTDYLRTGKKHPSDFHLNFCDRNLTAWSVHLEALGKSVVEASTNWSNAKLQDFRPISSNGQIIILAFCFDKSDFLTRIFCSDFSLSSLFGDVLNDSGPPSVPVKQTAKVITNQSTELPTDLPADLPAHLPTEQLSTLHKNLATLSIQPRRILIITIESSDEWSTLRVNFLREWLAHIFSALGASIDQLNLNDLNALVGLLAGNHLDDHPAVPSNATPSNNPSSKPSIRPIKSTDYQLVYLILPHKFNFRDSSNLLGNWKNMKVIRAGKIYCDGHSDYAEYRAKLSEELRDAFDDRTVDSLVRMRILSYKPSHPIKLDLVFKRIVFLHYNYARLFALIHRCYSLFNSKFDLPQNRSLPSIASSIDGRPSGSSTDASNGIPNDIPSDDQRDTPTGQAKDKTSDIWQIKNSQSTSLLKELENCPFIEHFIGLSSFKFGLHIDQVEAIGPQLQNRLLLLCQHLSKYYQHRKVLDHSPCAELLSFKVNLLRSVLSLMGVYFSLLGIAPVEKI